MDTSIPGISPQQLIKIRSSANAPLLIDVRREAAFKSAPDMAAGALRRDPATVEQWAGELPAASAIAVYCVHGHEVSQNVAKALRSRGFKADFVEDGIEEGLRAAGSAMMAKPVDAGTRWITRERPKSKPARLPAMPSLTTLRIARLPMTGRSAVSTPSSAPTA